MAESQQSRRGFLKIATTAIGGAIGAIVALPLVRYIFFPVGRQVVSSGSEPIDVLDEETLAPGAPPIRVQINARQMRDGWGVSDDVPMGAAWVRKTEDGQVEALSSVCPHLGCAVDFDAADGEFKCPCHRSSFALDGEKKSGPSKRGLDPLPVQVENGRVKLTFVRYRADIAEREPV
jgi:menaquinol-cytochrome c reductase iron-sulfur subunit